MRTSPALESSNSVLPTSRAVGRGKRRGDEIAQPLRVEGFRWKAAAELTPQALALTYWFDAPDEGEPFPVTIHFSGRRVGVRRKPGPRDSFSTSGTVERVVPGSGPLAVTTRVFDIAPGDWNVTATPARDRRVRAGTTSARIPKLVKAAASGTTFYAPVVGVQAPGARVGAWPALVGLGVVVALITQALLVSRVDLSIARVLFLSLGACLIGLVGAKAYYLVEHRRESPAILTSGMCIQGFVLGAIGTLVAGGMLAAIPVGRLLDATAPGLMFAMTIGRFGCFFGGCCAGRPTGSRFALWSSDRNLGARRIPTQLIESSGALLVGLVALLAVTAMTPDPSGVVFVGAIAAYTLGRQLLFPLRDLPRTTSHGRLVVMALTSLVLVVDVVVALF